jgi:hypothetical protein
MMAAVQAAFNGHQVTLLEKNEKLGKKIYITGKGRCNVTNACDVEQLFKAVYSNPKFLYSAFYGFDNQQTMEYIAPEFTSHGEDHIHYQHHKGQPQGSEAQIADQPDGTYVPCLPGPEKQRCRGSKKQNRQHGKYPLGPGRGRGNKTQCGADNIENTPQGIECFVGHRTSSLYFYFTLQKSKWQGLSCRTKKAGHVCGILV